MINDLLRACAALGDKAKDMHAPLDMAHLQASKEINDPYVQADATKHTIELLAQASVLFLRAVELPTLKASRRVHCDLDNALNQISGIARYADQGLKGIMFAAHGYMKICLGIFSENNLFYFKSRGFPVMEFGKKELQWLQAYNAIHWGGIAQFYGVPPRLQGLSVNCNGTDISFDEQGRIAVTSELVRQLIASTPHLIEATVKEWIPITVSGSANMTLPELFTLLRTASNSLHSTTLGVICSKMGQALNDQEAIEKAIELEHRATHNIYLRSKEAALQVKSDISRRAFQKFGDDHFVVLMRAAGYPYFPNISMSQLNSTYRLQNADLAGLFSLPKREYGLQVELKDRVAVVTDTGISSLYIPISQNRKGGRTSGFIQNAVADIRRDIRSDGCTATVRFKRVACG